MHRVSCDVQVQPEIRATLNALGVVGLGLSQSGYVLLPPKYEVLELISESAYGRPL